MLKYSLHLLLLCSPVIVIAQDILVKRDSSKIEAKILEIRPAELKYKYFNYQDGPTLIIDKNEVAYAIYANGQTERFQVIQEAVSRPVYVNVTTMKKAKKDSLRASKALSDYIMLNVEAGLVMNENYANKPYANYVRLGSLGAPEDEFYSGVGPKSTTYGWSVGINFLGGKSPFCKHLIGINYLNSTGEFNYSHSRGVYDNQTQTWIGYEKEARYKSTVHFINVLTGVRFIIYKKLCIDNAIVINMPFKAVNTVNGYEVNYKRSHSNYHEEVHTFNNEITHDSKVATTVSFVPKLSYEFYWGNQKLGVHFSYTISYKYNLPWYVAGITYYPFKKLRDKERIPLPTGSRAKRLN